MFKIPKQAYTAEFKEQAVKCVTEVGSMGRVAEDLGLVEQTLHNWVKAAKAGKLNPAGVASGSTRGKHGSVKPARWKTKNRGKLSFCGKSLYWQWWRKKIICLTLYFLKS